MHTCWYMLVSRCVQMLNRCLGTWYMDKHPDAAAGPAGRAGRGERQEGSAGGRNGAEEEAALVAQLVKNPPAMQETWVRSLGREDPPEKGRATHSSILA